MALNVGLSVFTCGLYVADSYERLANDEARVSTSPLLQTYIDVDFAVSLVFVLIFTIRAYVRGCRGDARRA